MSTVYVLYFFIKFENKTEARKIWVREGLKFVFLIVKFHDNYKRYEFFKIHIFIKIIFIYYVHGFPRIV